MNSLRKISLSVLGGVLISLAGCHDEELHFNKTARPPATPPGDYADNPNSWDYPSPTISKQTFIPNNINFAHTKSIAWRIEWPEYAGGVSPDQIPTFFATSKGALNSFDFLQGGALSNKQKVNFSLYIDNKLVAAMNHPNLLELDEFGPENDVNFKKYDMTPQGIEILVTQQPSHFSTYYVDAENSVEEPEYEEGDFFLFKIESNPVRYGGIRIVSESPRIIEVYLAVVNN